MGRAANLSPLGLYNWDSHVFDLFQIPSEMDMDILLPNLLAQTAELEVLYPNPVVFKNLVGVWSQKNLPVWEKLYATTQFEYNPIENYNRYEEGTEDGSSTVTHSGTDTTSDTETHTGTDTRTQGLTAGGEDTVEGTDTKGQWVAGYDSTPSGDDDGLVKKQRDQDDFSTTTSYGRTDDLEENKTYGSTIGRTGSMTHGEEVETEREGGHELHAHGNIGVTSTQDMIKQERQIDLFNVYDIIIEDFKMRFCILVY